MSEVLVCGGAGFIGSNLTDELVKQGHDVTVADNLSTGRLENIESDVRISKFDINDNLPVGNYDYIFHLAAKARVQPSIKNPVEWNKTNVEGTLRVIELARKVGAKVIFSSSSSVYGDSEQLPTPETAELNPKSPYALQKLIGEQYLKLYGEIHDLDYTVLRYFNVYGDRMIPGGAYSAVIELFKESKRKGETLKIRNNGEQRRDFTYVGDVVDANIRAMGWPREAFNIGNGDNRSVNEIADAVEGEKEYIGEVIEPFETLADNSKARSLGWEPTKDVIDWIKENAD